MRTGKYGVWLICLFFLLTGCKYDTVEEAIKKDIPFNIIEVIHIERVQSGVIVLYTTKQKNHFQPIEALAVAFINGSDKTGWENLGNNHWGYNNEHQDFSIYPNTFYKFDKKGNIKQEIPVVYGVIKNPAIKSVQVLGKERKYEDAQMIEKNKIRYFFRLDTYEKSRGVTEEGKIVSQISNLR
ncbi:hypothetical protein ACE38V_03740 [Cytobacillus sp. Hz8]|uniref:hypothetical protein n=1 Tax=Cytobacillus sp. Hz8 TaxID=3347168 RepID=UPI0035E21884